MRLSEVTLEHIRSAANWRLKNPDELMLGGAPDRLEIEPADTFDADDHVVYSGVTFTDSGRVYGLLLVRRVGEYDFGGDYYEFKNGAWRRLGLEPDPTADLGDEYIANPLPNDPSFGTANDDTRNMFRAKFRELVGALST